MWGDIIIIGVIILHTSESVAVRSKEHDLIEDLFTDYNPKVRPVLDANDTVQVSLSLSLSKLNYLDLKSEKLSISGWITVMWYDKRLTWESTEYGGIEVVAVTADTIWIPSFTLDNSVDDDVYKSEHYTLFKVTIDSDGLVSWEPGGHLVSKCDVNVKFYPFDSQICSLIFANWVYHGNQVNLSIAEDANETMREVYSEHGEWILENFDISREEFSYKCCPQFYPEISFNLHFKRRALYYAMNIVLPSVMLSVLVLMVFKLPPDSGEKMSLGVTLMLAYSVFLLIVSDNVPKTSQAVPVIVVYIIFSMSVTCISVLLEVLVLMAHHNRSECRPPAFLRHLVRGNNRNEPINAISPKPSQHEINIEKRFSSPGNHSDQQNSDFRKSHSPRAAHETSKENVQLCDTELICHLRQKNIDKHQDDLVEEWRSVAEALDAILFWVMLIIVILGIIILLCVLPLINAL